MCRNRLGRRRRSRSKQPEALNEGRRNSFSAVCLRDSATFHRKFEARPQEESISSVTFRKASALVRPVRKSRDQVHEIRMYEGGISRLVEPEARREGEAELTYPFTSVLIT